MGEFGATTDSGPNAFTLSSPVGAPSSSSIVPPAPLLTLGTSTVSQSFNSFSFEGFTTGAGVLVAPVADDVGIEAWVRATNTSDISIIVHQGSVGTNTSGFGLLQLGSVWTGHISGITFVGSAPVVVDEWIHLALVINGGVREFYVNGVLNATSPGTFGIYDPFDTLSIGLGRDSFNDTYLNFFTGLIDEVRYFTFNSGEFDPGLDLNIIPEPSTWIMLVGSLLVVMVLRRRRVAIKRA